MTTVTCPECDRVGTTTADLAVGAKVRCPACDHKFVFGTRDDATVMAAVLAPEPEKPEPLEVIVVGRHPLPIPWESPCYMLLEMWAYVHILVAALTGFLSLTQLDQMSIAFFAFVASSVIGLIGSALFMFLAVDIARNIRAQRYKM